MNRIKNYLTYIIIATFPIMSIINIGNISKFNLALSDIFIVVLGILWIIDIKNFRLKKNYPYFWYFTVLIIVFLVSNVHNLNSNTVSSGVSGIISEALKFIISAVYLFIGYNTFQDKSEISNIIKFWLIGLWIFIFYGLYAQITVFSGGIPWIFNQALGNHNRFLGTITDSNAAALYLSISFFIIICYKNYLFENKKLKILLNITNIFVFICILLTMSRGGIIGFFAGLGIYIIYNIKYFIRKLYLVPLLLCIGLSIFYIDTNYLKNQFTNNFISRSQDVTDKTGMFDIRLNLSLSAIDMGFDNPIIGVGRSNYSLNSKEYIIQNGGDWEKDFGSYNNMVAHNTLAGIFAELGIIGLITFISIFAIMFLKIIKSKYVDTNFKIIILSMWFSIFVQSLSICLENLRVLWIVLGLTLIVLDRRINIEKIYERLETGFIWKQFYVSIISIIISIILYINVAPKYIYYNGIDISNDKIQLNYVAKEMGEYTLRYNISTTKVGEKDKNMTIDIENTDDGNILNSVKYDVAGGYGNIYFNINKETNLKFNFNGQGSSKVSEIKLIKPNSDVVILLDNYPLLTDSMFKKYRNNGKLVDFEVLNKFEKNFNLIRDFKNNTIIDLGEKVRYKGVNITKLDDGNTQFEFTFECLDILNYDYVMWMHLGVNDINTIPIGQLPMGYINCDHSMEIPMTQWEVGKEYKHKYVINLARGEYQFSFGFWLWEEGDRPVVRLYNEKNEAGIDLGWFTIK